MVRIIRYGTVDRNVACLLAEPEMFLVGGLVGRSGRGKHSFDVLC